MYLIRTASDSMYPKLLKATEMVTALADGAYQMNYTFDAGIVTRKGDQQIVFSPRKNNNYSMKILKDKAKAQYLKNGLLKWLIFGTPGNGKSFATALLVYFLWTERVCDVVWANNSKMDETQINVIVMLKNFDKALCIPGIPRCKLEDFLETLPKQILFVCDVFAHDGMQTKDLK